MIIPKRFESVKYEDIPEEIKKLVENMGNSMRGLYIHGNCGVGKTHIAYAIGKRAEEIKIGAMFFDFSNLINFLKEDFIGDNIDRKSEESNIQPILNFKGLLIIDDIGSQRMTNWVTDRLYEIVNKRYEDILPTIFTSNLSLEELVDRVGDRVVSRIAGSSEVVELGGGDRRIN